MLRLREKYLKEVIPLMKEKFGHKGDMAVPKIEKVVVNIGFGRLFSTGTSDEQRKLTENILNDLTLITGQRPTLAKAKKSISGFKIRQGMPIGAKVTLRRKKMYGFLEKIINVVLPRSRDFRGIEKVSVDNTGNLTIGIKEHITFPEISPEKTRFNLGLEVTVVNTAKDREEAIELLKLLGFPLKI